MIKVEFKRKKILSQIKNVMQEYQKSLDRSLKQRKVTYCFEPSSKEFKKLKKMLDDAEKKCLNLDRKLYELFLQFQLTKYE